MDDELNQAIKQADEKGDDPNLWNIVAEILIKQKRYNKASKILKKILLLDKNHPKGLTNTALIYMVNANLNEAEQLLLHSLEYDKEYYLTWFRLGIIKLNQKKLAQAIKNLEKALSLNQSFYDSYLNIGWS